MFEGLSKLGVHPLLHHVKSPIWTILFLFLSFSLSFWWWERFRCILLANFMYTISLPSCMQGSFSGLLLWCWKMGCFCFQALYPIPYNPGPERAFIPLPSAPRIRLQVRCSGFLQLNNWNGHRQNCVSPQELRDIRKDPEDCQFPCPGNKTFNRKTSNILTTTNMSGSKRWKTYKCCINVTQIFIEDTFPAGETPIQGYKY